MDATAIDIKTMLEDDPDIIDSSLEDYEIHIGIEPHTPPNVITIIETMGFRPQLTFNKEEIYEYPSVQIRIRSTDYDEGWRVISAIKNSLHGRGQETWNGTLYSVIRCSGGPAFLDADKNQRIRFIVNFNIQRR